jgi:hypothetical protein
MQARLPSMELRICRSSELLAKRMIRTQPWRQLPSWLGRWACCPSPSPSRQRWVSLRTKQEATSRRNRSRHGVLGGGFTPGLRHRALQSRRDVRQQPQWPSHIRHSSAGQRRGHRKGSASTRPRGHRPNPPVHRRGSCCLAARLRRCLLAVSEPRRADWFGRVRRLWHRVSETTAWSPSLPAQVPPDEAAWQGKMRPFGSCIPYRLTIK